MICLFMLTIFSLLVHQIPKSDKHFSFNKINMHLFFQIPRYKNNFIWNLACGFVQTIESNWLYLSIVILFWTSADLSDIVNKTQCVAFFFSEIFH